MASIKLGYPIGKICPNLASAQRPEKGLFLQMAWDEMNRAKSD
jgi:hypothetical protein